MVGYTTKWGDNASDFNPIGNFTVREVLAIGKYFQLQTQPPHCSAAKKQDGMHFRPADYSFSLTWGTYGYSSYDSETGELIKSKDATNPDEYTTELKLSEEQYSAIWGLIKDLDIESYPDEYNPHGNGVSTPYMTLILSVKADGLDKTVTVTINSLNNALNSLLAHLLSNLLHAFDKELCGI